ncbi:MAG: periplasmic or secreted lipoprotein [Rhizobium sp.]|nr:periplasmic or secreted lipoprotein [Rhizobium sp.]
MIGIETDSGRIIRRLNDDGFVLISVKGSHQKFGKDGKTVIVPHPKKDLPVGTARNIAKQAGWL